MDRSPSKEKNERGFYAAAIIVMLAICFLVFKIFFLDKAKPAAEEDPLPVPTALSTGNQEKPDVTTSLDSVTVSLERSVVFDLENLDFRFVIMTVHVHADEPINITLDHFTTNEGIRLSDVDSYVSSLENNSLYLGRQNVWFSLISNETDYEANLFVPVTDSKADSITISCDFGKNTDMKIPLANPKGTASMLAYQADDIITDGRTYQLTVSEAYEITGDYLYQTVGGIETEYLLPSTTKVYAFRVNAVSLWGDTIVIEDAQYYPSTEKEAFPALDSTIRSMKMANILGREIHESDSGFLFFYAYDPDDHPVTYKGVLKLRLQGSENAISINVDLN